MEEKKFKKVEDLLPEGEHLIKVYPQNIWSKEQNKYLPNTLKSGTTKWGNWYMFKTKIGEEWISIFANDENKEFFESGYVKANIVPKRMKGVEGDMYDVNGKKLLKTFYNRLSPAELEMAKKKEKSEVYEAPVDNSTMKVDDIDVENIDF